MLGSYFTWNIRRYVLVFTKCKDISCYFFQAENVDFSRLWNPKLYIENSLGDPKEQIRHRIIYNDKAEAFIYEKRVAKGTFMENLELDDFPFDVQVTYVACIMSKTTLVHFY